VVELSALVAEATGDVDAATQAYEQLAALDPTATLPAIRLAALELDYNDDPDRALELLAAAEPRITDPEDRIEAIFTRTKAYVAKADRAAALATLTAIDAITLAAGDREPLATLALEAEAPELALSFAQPLLAEPELEPAERANVLHLLGAIYAELGRDADMAQAWRGCRDLDAQTVATPVVDLSNDELDAIASAALAELPANARQLLERVPILVDEAPSDALIADGVDPRLLGLFQGTPLPEGGDLAPSVTAIWLFRRNLMQLSESRDDVVEEVRITVLHETAHYFGMDEADLEELGLD